MLVGAALRGLPRLPQRKKLKDGVEVAELRVSGVSLSLDAHQLHDTVALQLLHHQRSIEQSRRLGGVGFDALNVVSASLSQRVVIRVKYYRK